MFSCELTWCVPSECVGFKQGKSLRHKKLWSFSHACCPVQLLASDGKVSECVLLHFY